MIMFLTSTLQFFPFYSLFLFYFEMYFLKIKCCEMRANFHLVNAARNKNKICEPLLIIFALLSSLVPDLPTIYAKQWKLHDISICNSGLNYVLSVLNHQQTFNSLCVSDISAVSACKYRCAFLFPFLLKHPSYLHVPSMVISAFLCRTRYLLLQISSFL